MSETEKPNPPAEEEEEKAIKSPEELALLQDMTDLKMQAISSYRKLPKPVKRRTKALKKLLSKSLEMEADYYRELHELERKYLTKQQALADRRREIVTGDIEPTDDDCEWASDEEEDVDGDLAHQITDKVTITEEKSDDKGEEPKDVNDKGDEIVPNGIPNFWLTILTNLEMTQEMIQDYDMPILEKLTDISCTLLSPEASRPGFRLDFHFASNDYFNNSVLSKEFYMRFEPAADDPLSYEGPEIVRCKGCTINWKKDKNVTVKTVRRTKKGKGGNKSITKVVQSDSFFNFFNAEENGIDGDEEVDEETETLLQTEFEIGQFLRERVIPRAVLYFTGEALEDDYDEDDEEEMDDDDDDDEDDEDYRPNRGGGHRTLQQRQMQQVQQNCKQQ